jgi:CHASE3 domain sensor protein
MPAAQYLAPRGEHFTAGAHTTGPVYDERMESGGLGDLFGNPEELQRRLAEFAEQMQGNQRLAWADNAIKLAVDMTVAAVERVNLQGNAEAQAEQIRTVMARVFPEAVTLVREAREGLQ